MTKTNILYTNTVINCALTDSQSNSRISSKISTDRETQSSTFWRNEKFKTIGVIIQWESSKMLYNIFVCPNGRKKSHCMRARRATCSQLRLDDASRRSVHSATQAGEMFIRRRNTWLPAINYALACNATFSTNLDTNRHVYLERHGGDVTRVNTARA